MFKFLFRLFCTLSLLLALVSGCATPLPPTYVIAGSGRVLEGPVLALAGEGDLVVAVNQDGLFIKDDDGPWIEQEVPGMSKFSRVTCLAVYKAWSMWGPMGRGCISFLREPGKSGPAVMAGFPTTVC